MFRRRGRFICTILAMVMLIMIIFPNSALAQDSNAPEKIRESILTASKESVYSVNGKQISEELNSVLSKYAVTVRDRSLIEVFPYEEDDANIIVVTNADNNNQVTKEMLFNVGETGKLQSMVNIEEKLDSSGHGVTIPYDNYGIVINATAVFNVRYYEETFPYVQPVGSYFILHNEKGKDVSYIETTYTCSGYSYSYPDFKDLNYFDEWSIPVKQANPQKNTIYHKVKEYSNYKVIYCDGGHLFAGQIMSIEFTLDGKTYLKESRIPREW